MGVESRSTHSVKNKREAEIPSQNLHYCVNEILEHYLLNYLIACCFNSGVYICWYIRHSFNIRNISIQSTFIFIFLFLKKICVLYTAKFSLLFHAFKARKKKTLADVLYFSLLIVTCHLWDFQISEAFWRTETFKLNSCWQLKSIFWKIHLFRCEVLTFVVIKKYYLFILLLPLNFPPYFLLFGRYRKYNFQLK